MKMNTDHIFRFFCPSWDSKAGLLVPLRTEEKNTYISLLMTFFNYNQKNIYESDSTLRQ